jgi:hypothetical protein
MASGWTYCFTIVTPPAYPHAQPLLQERPVRSKFGGRADHG